MVKKKRNQKKKQIRKGNKSSDKKNIFLLSLTIIVIIIDQLTKYLVRNFIRLNQSIPIIKNIFHLTYRYNTGAGFGILQNQNLLLIIIGIVVLAFVINFCLKSKEHAMKIMLSLLSGGIIGNLIDRIIFGHVIDFIDLRIWPVFNVADSVITIIVIALIIYLWKK